LIFDIIDDSGIFACFPARSCSIVRISSLISNRPSGIRTNSAQPRASLGECRPESADFAVCN
jgi:hypothetical protein